MKKLFVLTLLLMVIFSCKKESPCTTNAASISGSYKVTAYAYKESASAAEVDYLNTIHPNACERDDILTFNINGTYQLKDAGAVCSPAGNENGNWSLSGNTMQIDGDAAAIESFDCKSLVLINTNIQVAGDKLKITLIKQ